MFPGGDEDRYSRGGLSEGRLSSACGTDEPSQWRYHHDLAAVGFEVIAMSFDYGVYSALGVTQLPAPDQRSAFAEQIRRAVAPHDISASTFTSRYWPGGHRRPVADGKDEVADPEQPVVGGVAVVEVVLRVGHQRRRP